MRRFSLPNELGGILIALALTEVVRASYDVFEAWSAIGLDAMRRRQWAKDPTLTPPVSTG